MSIEYGVRVDCEKNKCAVPHVEHGLVIELRGSFGELPVMIDGHRVTRVVRTVSEWAEIEEAELAQLTPE